MEKKNGNKAVPANARTAGAINRSLVVAGALTSQAVQLPLGFLGLLQPLRPKLFWRL